MDKAINESQASIINKYGSSPKMAEMLSQVYSKIATDGDADKLAVFENYINTNFKDALNRALPELQKLGPDVLPGAAVGELQFKGVSGISTAGENDVFSIKWGYKDDDAYDTSTAKRFLQEDTRGVKAVKEKEDMIAQNRMAAALDNSDEEKRLRSQGLNKTDTAEERFAAERRQNKMEEALTTKFGQLSDSAQEELREYLRNNFSEEEAEKFLEHAAWNKDIMTGLAAIHNDITESGSDKTTDFINFINGALKHEVTQISEKLDGLTFEGWQASDNIPGALEATLKFSGQPEGVRITVVGSEEDLDETLISEMQSKGDQSLAFLMQNGDRADNTPSYAKKTNSTGYLINLTA